MRERRLRRKPVDEASRKRRRLRLRRHGRRAYIRSVYSLPSLATLGNAVCGFGAMYVTTLDTTSRDWVATFFHNYRFVAAAYLIFAAMVFDALDGRLARFTRHTTDFGGQLDSLADVISFGAAPAFLALQVFRDYYHASPLPTILTRMVWAVAAMYMSCAALRLARFNVSNKHGEQHHFSFLGLPSPGAAAAVAAFILMQQDLAEHATAGNIVRVLADTCVALLPLVVLMTGLLMVSGIRYPHLVNRYLRGKMSMGSLLFVVTILLLLVVAHRYTLGLGTMLYVLMGLTGWGYARWRHAGKRGAKPGYRSSVDVNGRTSSELS